MAESINRTQVIEDNRDSLLDQTRTIKDIQESLLKAMDSLVNDRLDKYTIDQTITCNIVRCVNALNGEYLVSYQGGNMTAYAEDLAAYSKGTSVYVLIPEGNFSNKKLILSRASSVGDDENLTFVSSMVNDYNPLGQNVISTKKQDASFGLHSYLHEDRILLYDYEDQENSLLNVNIEEFSNYIKNADAVILEASFLTRLTNEHRNTRTGIYGLQFVLAFQDRSTAEPTYKTLSYVIDTNSMTGNPYAFRAWSNQYAIYPIDTENFVRIQSIMFYSQAFEAEDDLIKDRLYGADIFCQEIEFYALKKITAVNGDYSLRLSTPQGATFKTSDPNASLSVLADVRYQNVPSDGWMFYWFKSDARVTTSSSLYKMYGGVGWANLEESKGTTNKLVVYEKENKAYENKYLCVAVYKEQVILKEEFIIFNDNSRREISIESDLGVKFSFDRGTPVLTCLIDGKTSDFDTDNATNRPDSWFTFVWSKLDMNGQVITFNKTYEEAEEEYKQAIAEDIDYNIILGLKSTMEQLKGVVVNKNIFSYPIRGIDNRATFRCSVYMKDKEDGESYYIGSADISLQNDSAATPQDYFIVIENGDQVFQYSESGVTPKSERYQDPQEILPLYCHFYDPAGLEVDKATYDVTWQVPYPYSTSMINTSKLSLQKNPSNDQEEYYIEEIFPMDIVDSFDYQALNNQITCIVKYKGQEYQKDTIFSFVKVGDNGTNGTDIVVKISPIDENNNLFDNDLLTLIESNGTFKWNNGYAIRQPVLKFNAYQREQKITLDSVTWSIASKKSSVLAIDNGDVTGVSLRQPSAQEANGALRCQIVKGQTIIDVPKQTGNEPTENEDSGSTLPKNLEEAKERMASNRTTYYAAYSIPMIKTSKGFDYPLHIDNKYTLKQIIYNSDGRNPLYNKNQGVKIRYTGADAASKRIVFQTIGGSNETPASGTAAFKIMDMRDGDKEKYGHDEITTTFDENGECLIYVLPEDVYTGLFTNNLVYGKIMSGGSIEAEFWVPIHMQLNTVELASLNAWDGNHIEINNDENYILAPQIGAGDKDSQNRFTGVVMGKAQQYKSRTPLIGLLGYSAGKQSIYMEAATGNTYLGLPDDELSGADTDEQQGRIELIPGGISSIANWKIDRRALYNISPDYSDYKQDDKYHKAEIDKPYTDKDAPKGSKRSVPHTKEGILLSADPAYLSIKGRPLIASEIDSGSDLNILNPGDSVEIQLDPHNLSAFTIFRHYQINGRWTRARMVGIKANGQFYANALQNTLKPPVENDKDNTTTGLSIGPIGAFGFSAGDYMYAGGSVGLDDNTIFKMFTEIKYNNTNPVYVNGSKDPKNDYQRPMKIYGKTIELFGEPSLSVTNRSTTQSSDVFIKLTSNLIGLQVEKPSKNGINNNFLIASGATGNSELNLGNLKTTLLGNDTTQVNGTTTQVREGNVDITVGKANSKNISTKLTLGGSITLTGASTGSYTYADNLNVETKKDYELKTQDFSFTLKQNEAKLENKTKEVYLHLLRSTTERTKLISTVGGIDILADGIGSIGEKASVNGMNIGCKNNLYLYAGIDDNTYARLHLYKEGGFGGMFALDTANGGISTKPDYSVKGSPTKAIGIEPGVGTGWLFAEGHFPTMDTTSIYAMQDIRTETWFYGAQLVLSDLANGAVLNDDGIHPPIEDTNVASWIRWADGYVKGLGKRIDGLAGRVQALENEIKNKSNIGHTHTFTVSYRSTARGRVKVTGTGNVAAGGGFMSGTVSGLGKLTDGVETHYGQVTLTGGRFDTSATVSNVTVEGDAEIPYNFTYTGTSGPDGR